MSVTNKLPQVSRVDKLENTQFYNEYFKPKKPVVLTEVVKGWPAMNKWSFEFFSALDTSEKFYIEKGNILQRD